MVHPPVILVAKIDIFEKVTHNPLPSPPLNNIKTKLAQVTGLTLKGSLRQFCTRLN